MTNGRSRGPGERAGSTLTLVALAVVFSGPYQPASNSMYLRLCLAAKSTQATPPVVLSETSRMTFPGRIQEVLVILQGSFRFRMKSLFSRSRAALSATMRNRQGERNGKSLVTLLERALT